MIGDLFMTFAEALTPAAPPPVPSSPPAISRPAELPKAPPPIKATPPPAKAGPAAPTRYRLADAQGQAFEHEDPGYLTGWINQRNADLLSQRSSAPQARVLYFQPVAPRACGPGGCR